MPNKFETIISQQILISDINPFLEIKRKKYFAEITDKFYSVIKSDIPHVKKDYIGKMITRFFFQQYVKDSYVKEKIDPFFPTANKEYSQLYDDLKYLLGNDTNKLESIVTKLNISELIDSAIDSMLKYYKSDKYADRKNNSNFKVVLNEVANYKNNTYYSLDFSSDGFTDSDNHKILIRKALYDKLKNKYHETNYKDADSTKINPDINVLIWCLLARYTLFEAKTQSLSVGHNIYTNIQNKYGTTIELFSSSLNSTFKNYCSLYYDIEKYFGSLGSFYNLNIKEGVYTFNPPFDSYVMDHAIIHLMNCLSESGTKLIIFGFIPIWDFETKVKMTKICENGKNKYKIIKDDFGKYTILEIMKNSKYLKIIKTICRDKMPYYEHIDGKLIFASDTYVFYLSNYLDADKIRQIM
jgi:hypothetical protein